MTVLYLRSRKRRPIRLERSIFPEDIQGSIPFGWCDGCGMECYEPGFTLCPACLRKEMKDEKTEIPLHPLRPGALPPSVR